MKYLLQGRGLKTHSVDAFPSSEEDSFPRLLPVRSQTLLAITCLEVRPEALPFGRGPTLTGKVKSTSKCLFPSHFLCKRDLVSLGLSGPFLDPVWTHPVSTCIPGLGDKIHILLSGSPNMVRPGNFLIIHPVAVFLLMTELALLPLGDF